MLCAQRFDIQLHGWGARVLGHHRDLAAGLALVEVVSPVDVAQDRHSLRRAQARGAFDVFHGVLPGGVGRCRQQNCGRKLTVEVLAVNRTLRIVPLSLRTL